MSQIVVDTDVASYTFNWHSLAQLAAAAEAQEFGAQSIVK